MEKHFVIFLSPGTFFHEETEKPIDSWNVDKAKEMAHGIKERYGATPFGFYFTTRSRSKDDLDSKVSKKSGTYYLGGKIRTIKDVEKANDPEEKILLSNMRGNGWNKIITNSNSWKVTQPLLKEDIVLDWTSRKQANAKS